MKPALPISAALAALLLAAGPAAAQDRGLFQQDQTAPADDPFGAGDEDEVPEGFETVIPGDSVVLRALNKVTAATRDIETGFDEPVNFGTMTIVARYCSTRPPEFIPETFVFLEIYDRTFDGAVTGEYGTEIFSGWMLASSPALHGLEHSVYDIWPVSCETAVEEEVAPTPDLETVRAEDAAQTDPDEVPLD